MAAVERLLDWTADARAELRLDAHLADLGALLDERQRRPAPAAPRTRRASRWSDVYAATVADTRATYADGRRRDGGAVRRGRHEPR